MYKQVSAKWGYKYYLLGADENGTKHWLQSASWDCGWYWGLGYVETFTRNYAPAFARDIESHQHFDNLFITGGGDPERFRQILPETPLTDKEIWTLLELMNAAYKAREYSDMIHIGGSHITSNPCKELLLNEAEYKRINEKVIPGIMDEVYELLTPSAD